MNHVRYEVVYKDYKNRTHICEVENDKVLATLKDRFTVVSTKLVGITD